MAPDVVCSWNWTNDANEYGIRGTVTAPGAHAATQGSISPWEVRNVFVAAGPSFKRGVVSDVPAGNVDLAPTVLHLLGVDSGGGLDGRVLREGLNGGPDPVSIAVEHDVLSSAAGSFAQSLQRSRAGGVTYVDSGCVARSSP